MLNHGHILTAAEMQRAEQSLIDAGISVEQLMDQAGQGAAQMVWRIAADIPTLVLCGPGNNGGDGYVIAQWLRQKGVDVIVAASADPKTDAAKNARAMWQGQTMDVSDAAPRAQFVDCLFGTGLTRPVDPPLFQQFQRLFSAAKRRVAVDLPSGVQSDNGMLLNKLGAFDLTIALGAYKPSHFLEPSRSKLGDLVAVPLGIDAASALSLVAKPKLTAPGSEDHKYTRGLLAIVAGNMLGAAQLSAMAAQRAGAGYVKLFGSKGNIAPQPSIVFAHVSDDTDLASQLSDHRISAVAIGPGLGQDELASAWLEAALQTEKPLLLDAGALPLVGRRFSETVKNRGAETVITPHGGEFAALTSSNSGNKLTDVRNLSTQSSATVLLKGADTVIARPDGETRIAGDGCSWLSTAGTGDVLTGIIASRLATGLSGFEAACQGQWIHNRAAQLAGPAFTPEILIDHIPQALQECL